MLSVNFTVDISIVLNDVPFVVGGVFFVYEVFSIRFFSFEIAFFPFRELIVVGILCCCCFFSFFSFFPFFFPVFSCFFLSDVCFSLLRTTLKVRGLKSPWPQMPSRSSHKKARKLGSKHIGKSTRVGFLYNEASL